MAPALLKLQLQLQPPLPPNHHRSLVPLRNSVPSCPSHCRRSNTLYPRLRSRTVPLPRSNTPSPSILHPLAPDRATTTPPNKPPSLRLLPTVSAPLMLHPVGHSLLPYSKFPAPMICARPAQTLYPSNPPTRGLRSRLGGPTAQATHFLVTHTRIWRAPFSQTATLPQSRTLREIPGTATRSPPAPWPARAQAVMLLLATILVLRPCHKRRLLVHQEARIHT